MTMLQHAPAPHTVPTAPVDAWWRRVNDTADDLVRRDPEVTAADETLAALGNAESALRAIVARRITPKVKAWEVRCMVEAAYRLTGGAVLYVNVRHVARSGMSRWMTVHGAMPDGHIVDLTVGVALLLGDKPTDRYADSGGRLAIRSGGCGFDAADALTQRLGELLHGDRDALRYERL